MITKRRIKGNIIKIKKSKRVTQDMSKVDLKNVTVQHIKEVKSIMSLISNMLKERGVMHDYTKMRYIDIFHRDLQDGVKDNTSSEWYNLHLSTERHHLQSGNKFIPKDVNLIDILECLSDCIAAGIGRNGKFTDINLPDELLQRAIKNTCKMILNNIELES